MINSIQSLSVQSILFNQYQFFLQSVSIFIHKSVSINPIQSISFNQNSINIKVLFVLGLDAVAWLSFELTIFSLTDGDLSKSFFLFKNSLYKKLSQNTWSTFVSSAIQNNIIKTFHFWSINFFPNFQLFKSNSPYINRLGFFIPLSTKLANTLFCMFSLRI